MAYLGFDPDKMDDFEDIDHEAVDYEELISEMETLEAIFQDEYKLLRSKPYKC